MRDLIQKEISSVSGGYKRGGDHITVVYENDSVSKKDDSKGGGGSTSDQSCFNEVVEQAGLGAIFSAIGSAGNPLATGAGALAGAVNAGLNSEECKSLTKAP
jgi:hypothetical protein